jgi:hypothetical protein
MDNTQREKLIALLNQRSKKIESIQNFDEYFDKFLRQILRNVMLEVNDILMEKTNESLRIFLEDPYENSKTRHFAMLQLIPESHRRNSFLFDNSRNLPSLIFEGDEFSGKVKVWNRIKDRKSGTEFEIDKLTEHRTFDIIISFIDNIYKV